MSKFLHNRQYSYSPFVAPSLLGAPVFTTAPAITGVPIAGQSLTCSPGVASGAPTYAFQWEWLSSGAPLSGATSANYTPIQADIDNQLVVVVTATNTFGSTSYTVFPTTPIVPAPDIVYSPTGDDSKAGTLAAPVKTPQQAQTLMRALIAANPNRSYCAMARGGTYRLSSQMIFSTADMVADGNFSWWINYPDEQAVWSAGVDLTGQFTLSGSNFVCNLSTNAATSALWAAGWRPHCAWIGGSPGVAARRAMRSTWPARGQQRFQTVGAGTSSRPANGNDVVFPADFGNAGGQKTDSITQKLTGLPTIASSGSGGGTGTVTLTGADGTGTKFVLTGTMTAGVLSNLQNPSVRGAYTVAPANANNTAGAGVAVTVTGAGAGSATGVQIYGKFVYLSADTMVINGSAEFDQTWTNPLDVMIRIYAPDAQDDCDSLIGLRAYSGTTQQSLVLNSHASHSSLPIGTWWRAEGIYEKMLPGDQYLNQSTGVMTLMPMAGENLATLSIVLPNLDDPIVISGAQAYSGNTSGNDIGNLRFGLQFSHSNSPSCNKGYVGTSQVPCLPHGVITCAGTKNLNFNRAAFINIGENAIIFGPGSHDNVAANSLFQDMGAGGIIQDGSVCLNQTRWPTANIPTYLQSQNFGVVYASALFPKQDRLKITNCKITDFSKVIMMSAGIWTRMGRGFIYDRVEISHGGGLGLHTGLSAGFPTYTGANGGHSITNILISYMGYEGGVAYQTFCTDYGALYNQGSFDGTLDGKTGVVYSNIVIHHCYGPSAYFGVYFDDYSEFVTLDRFLVYQVANFRQIKGQNNVITSGIFYSNFGDHVEQDASAGGSGVFAPYAPSIHVFTINPGAVNPTYNLTLRNVVDMWQDNANTPGYDISWPINPGAVLPSVSLRNAALNQDYNIIFKKNATSQPKYTTDATLATWRAIGPNHDNNTVQVDPGFTDPDNGDFTYGSSSPMHNLPAFTPVDMNAVGVSGLLGPQ